MLGADLSEIDFTHAKGCTCCGPSAFEATLVDMATVALDMAVQRVALDDWQVMDVAPEVDADVSPTLEPVNDPFLEYELVIAGVLAEHAASFLPEAEAILKKPFVIPVQRSERTAAYTARIEEAVAAVEEINRVWQNRSLTTADEDAIEYALGDALTAGAVAAEEMTGSFMALPATARGRITNGMIRSSKYYSNQFFTTQVMPALVKAIEQGAGTIGDNLIFETIKDVLHERLKTVPYWRVVANAAASRAYHYGVLKSGQAAGKRYFVFNAKLDEKTSAVCEALHGTQWPVADAVNLIDRIAEADPEEVKTLAPWLKEKDVLPLLSNPFGLRSLGIIVPPLHGNCRSTIILI